MPICLLGGAKSAQSVNKFYIERTTTALEIGRHGRIPIGTRDRAKLANQFYIERLTILLLEDKKTEEKVCGHALLLKNNSHHHMLKCHILLST